MSPTRPHRSRRRAIVAGTALMTLLTGGTISGAPSPATATPAQALAPAIGLRDRASPRAVWPPLSRRTPDVPVLHTGGLMTSDSIARQVAQIQASGAGGFEANQLTKVVDTAPGYDPATMDWGTTAWTNTQRGLFEQGRRAGLRVDHIYSPRWSASTTTVTPDGPGSAKQITFGRPWVNAGATYTGPLPTAALPPTSPSAS